VPAIIFINFATISSVPLHQLQELKFCRIFQE